MRTLQELQVALVQEAFDQGCQEKSALSVLADLWERYIAQNTGGQDVTLAAAWIRQQQVSLLAMALQQARADLSLLAHTYLAVFDRVQQIGPPQEDELAQELEFLLEDNVGMAHRVIYET